MATTKTAAPKKAIAPKYKVGDAHKKGDPIPSNLKLDPETNTLVKQSHAEILLRLGPTRVTKACKAVGLIGNLSTYKPTDPQIDRIMLALGETCAAVEARLRGTRRSNTAFRLD